MILPAKGESAATVKMAAETNKEIFIFAEFLTDPLRRLVVKSHINGSVFYPRESDRTSRCSSLSLHVSEDGKKNRKGCCDRD